MKSKLEQVNEMSKPYSVRRTLWRVLDTKDIKQHKCFRKGNYFPGNYECTLWMNKTFVLFPGMKLEGPFMHILNDHFTHNGPVRSWQDTLQDERFEYETYLN